MSRRRMQTKHTWLIVLNAAVWTLIGLAWRGTVQLSATNLVPIEVIAEPARVRITINGNPWSNGNYLTTPTVITLPIGQNKVTLQRAGYHSNTSSIVLQSPKDRPRISSVLEASLDGLRELAIEPLNDVNLDDVEVSVDGGLEKGQIPLTVLDLVPGPHSLDISTGMWTKKSVQCQFEVPVQPSKDPLKITVDRVGKKIKVSGCKRAH